MTSTRSSDSKKAGGKGTKQAPAAFSVEPSVMMAADQPVPNPAVQPAPAAFSVEPSVTIAADQPVPNPGVQPAYLSYLHARKGLATAFRGRQLYDKQAYDDSQRCYQSYEQAIEGAFKTRQKAEREALAIYRAAIDNAVEKASLEYRERMKHASIQCKKTTDDAWKASMQTSGAMADIFNNDQTLPQIDTFRAGGLGANIAESVGRGIHALKRATVSVSGYASGLVKRVFEANGKRNRDTAVDANA